MSDVIYNVKQAGTELCQAQVQLGLSNATIYIYVAVVQLHLFCIFICKKKLWFEEATGEVNKED